MIAAGCLLCSSLVGEEAITQYRYRPFSGSTPPAWVSSYLSASTVLPSYVEQQRGTLSDAFQDFSFGVFDGANTIYACDDDVANNDLSKDFSVFAVLSPTSTTGTQTICSTFTTDRQEGFRLAITDGVVFGELVFADGTLHTVTASVPIVAGNWYQIGYRLMADAAAQTQSVDLWVNSTKVASSTFSDVNQINHSPLDPAIGADLNQQGAYTDFLDASVYTVQVDDYGISDFFMEAPVIRDGSRGLGAPSFHDYIGSTKPLALRVSETIEKSQYAELRSRLNAHYFFPFSNDNYIPQGIAADEQNNRIFLSMYYKDANGENLDNHASLIAEIFMPEGRLGNVFLLHNEDASPILSHVGGIAYRDGHLYVPAAQDLLVFSIEGQAASSFDPDTLTGFAPINIQPIKRFSSMVSFNSIAFVNIHTDASNTALLTLGDFDLNTPSSVDVFELTSSTTAVYRSSFTEVQEKAQGIAVYQDDQQTKHTLLSQSYGSGDSGIYTGTYTNGGAVATSSSLLLSGPAGFEDVVVYNDALWSTSESGAKYYQKRSSPTPWSPLFPFLFSVNIADLIDAAKPGTLIQFNGISGSNNGGIPAGFGSNLSSSIPGATVIDGGTPGVALGWADSGTWELHGSGNDYWAALDADGPSSSTPTVAQMESGSPQHYIDFTVADGSQLILNSVDIGMAFDKTDTYNFTITIAEVGGAVVATYTPPTMDGDGSSGVQAQTVDFSFTGDPSVDYRLQFEDAPDTNGGAIDNLSFSEIVGVDTTPPSLSPSDSLNPAGGSTDVSLTADFVVTFHENIAVGTGNIVIRSLADDSVVDTIAVSSGNVVIDGAQVIITPSAALEKLKGYYIEIDAGAFVDLAGNSFAGISGSNVWYFTTTEGLRLHIAGNSSTVDFWWEGTPHKAYDLLSSTDLTVPLDAWPVYDPDGNDPFSDIAFGGIITTLPAVPVADSSRFFALAEKDAPLVVIAHRGDSVNAPENTIASITSIAGTAELSEMDAQVTSDGVLVLMHDGTIDRTTDGTGTVASKTLAQIQTLDAGSWFAPEFAGEPVPTLAAAISAAIASGVEPLVERKKGDAAVYHAEFVAQGLSVNDFRVISFDKAFLNALDALNRDYRLGWLGSSAITQAVIDEAQANGADFLSWSDSEVNQAAVDLVNANGLELMVWTVNGEVRMQELIDLGVRGITTDDPALLRSLLP